jgi:hypothetical protein
MSKMREGIKMKNDSIFSLSKQVRIREEEFGGIVYDFMKEKAIAVNKTGLSIIRLLEEQSCTIDQLTADLSNMYQGDSTAIRNSVVKFLEKMTEAGIIEGGTTHE